MKRAAALLSGVAIALGAAPGWADGPAGALCGDAYTKAQTLRNERKLLLARDALRTCAQPTCKDFIVKDCVDWLDQVQRSLPSVVPVATDPQGNALLKVKVLVDGVVLLEQIDGRSVDVDPGPHVFSFESADGSKAEKQMIVSEGEHDKRIAVTLGTAPTPAVPAAAPAPAPSPGTPPRPAPAAEPAPAAPIVIDASAGVQWKAIGLANAGVGVAALAVGGIFGGLAISKKGSAHCTSSNVCPDNTAAQTLRDAGTAATTATIFFVAGGVLTAGGLALWVLAPSSKVQAAPTVGSGGGGLVVRGTW